MAINVTDIIRKTMGWCPNASAFEARKPVRFDNIPAGASGGIGGAIRRISEMQGMKGALVVVGIYAILNALGVYISAEKISYVFEGYGNFDMGGLMSIMKKFIVLGALVSAFIMWVIGTEVVHIVSKVLGGKGKFYPHMITMVGYSFIPFLFAGLASLALLLIMEPMTVTVSPGNPMGYTQIYGNPYMLASTIFAIIMQVMVSAILFFGVRRIHGLTPAKSAVVAGIPLAFNILSLASILRSSLL
ncbi:Yip1 domain protein [uncultured archaeon]|nr:Yip1 domain protein [uncultured archaeon]